MQAFTWPGQQHRDHIVNEEENTFLTGWRLGCPNCGEMIAATSSQYIHEINEFRTGSRVFARLSTVCLHCSFPLTELWSIN
ncbi:MAG TPA: hypothetical protein HPP76_06940 [Desulfuromonadales bacterium]|nr:hypothetical protein [Desulfuromonadales bacterium]